MHRFVGDEATFARASEPIEGLARPSDAVVAALDGTRSFAHRMRAFRAAMDGLRVSWEVGRVEFVVDRGTLLADAFGLLGTLPDARWRQPFFVKFRGEDGLDAGGLSREFFMLASAKLFDASIGLFRVGSSENLTYQIVDDDDADVAVADARAWFAFAGRLLGKALLEGHHFADAHLNMVLLKHMASEPVGLDDLELVDNELFKSLDQLRTMDPADVETLCATFSIEHIVFGAVVTKDLIPGGRDVAVTGDNVHAFLTARLRERVFDVCRKGLASLLAGVFAVVPKEVCMLLSARELELALCGVPDIDVDAWRRSTVYKGAFAAAGKDHDVVAWFWDILKTWDRDRLALLLQWCTGTSRVPVQGFEHLMGRDGARRPFTLTSVPLETAIFPRAHTCFNRIDLPLFETKEALERAFDIALNLENAAGFSMD